MKPVLLLAALGAALLGACSPPAPPPPAARPVVVHELALAPLAAAALYSGEVRARHESELAFRVAGKIVERRVELGSMVTPGQVLARLDPADAGLAATAAAAQLAAARADHALAEAEVLRYRELLARGFVSKSALDTRESAFKAAAARVEQARAQATVAANQAAYTTLVADEAGVITAVNAEVGQAS